MGAEREIKFRVEDRSALLARLVELEAEQVNSSQFEDNWVFDRGDELREQSCVLRLRVDGQGAYLTFKGPPSFEGAVKVREEHETAVEDPEATRELLEALGFQAVTRYQKRREEWRVGGITVALDNTPMGNFAEFEGEGVEKLAARCGFDGERAERRSYLELWADYREGHPEAPEEMVFP